MKMNRREQKVKAKISSKSKFMKKFNRKDRSTASAPKRRNMENEDPFRESWPLREPDTDMIDANEDDDDIDDIADMIDPDLLDDDDIERRFEQKKSKSDDNDKSRKDKMENLESFGGGGDEMDADKENEDKSESKSVNNDGAEFYANLAGRSAIEHLAMIRDAKSRLRQKVAITANEIISHPEANINRLKKLFTLLDATAQDPDYGLIFFSVQQIVSKALCVIFIDIIPNYRLDERFNAQEIEIPKSGSGGNAQRKQQQLNRETLKRFTYEKTLLQFYRLYLHRLDRMINGLTESNFISTMLRTAKARLRLAAVACACLAELLSRHYAFNYRAQLIDSLTKVLCTSGSARRADNSMRTICARAFSHLFRADTLGDASSEAIRSIIDRVVACGYRVTPIVFRTFLSLNLRDLASLREDDSTAVAKFVAYRKTGLDSAKKDRKQLSRKERKRAKHLSKLEKELLEAEAVEDRTKRLANQAEIHKHLFALYFRFMKHCTALLGSEDELPDFDRWFRPLLAPLFRGIAQFALYLNATICHELIESLIRLIRRPADDRNYANQAFSIRLTAADRLRCLKTISQILSSSNFETLSSIDFEIPYAVLYELCADPVAICGADESTIRALLECIDEMIVKRFKQLSPKRVISFVQRLILLTVSLSGAETIAILAIIKRLFAQHPAAADFIFDPDDDDAAADDDYTISAHSSHAFSFAQQSQRSSTDHISANCLRIFDLLQRRHCDPYVRYLSYAIVSHYSSSSGSGGQSNDRSSSIADNRALTKRANELKLAPKLGAELLRTNSSSQAYESLSWAANIDLNSILLTNGNGINFAGKGGKGKKIVKKN